MLKKFNRIVLQWILYHKIKRKQISPKELSPFGSTHPKHTHGAAFARRETASVLISLSEKRLVWTTDLKSEKKCLLGSIFPRRFFYGVRVTVVVA